MLGLGKPKKTWYWEACGKHPVARDYFKISYNTPVFTAFESWMGKGYAALTKRRKLDPKVYSWRFWAKGLKKGDLVGGVVRDSSDSIGRPYPLLIIGKGKLEGWEEAWECLPFYFERTWEQLEYISSRRLNGFNDFEKDIKSIKRPDNERGRLYSPEERINQSQPAFIDENQAKKTADSLLREMMALIPLSAHDDAQEQAGYQTGYLAQAGTWSSLLKTYGSGIPNAIFIGGAREKYYLAVFSRPINAEDFIRLWSVLSP
ncbi:MAG: DUF2094 domain-containing protein [Desulfobacteraceae bacterium]|nr:DUF2094 domain-containing protein [Desulfobacteraceae bacterium]MBC2754363.1 DUF2094 domain-containing protein [Desulfobacteraceae bacterium]